MSVSRRTLAAAAASGLFAANAAAQRSHSVIKGERRYIENTGDDDLVFLEMSKAQRYQDISLNEWITHIPPEPVMQHLGNFARNAGIPSANLTILPR